MARDTIIRGTCMQIQYIIYLTLYAKLDIFLENIMRHSQVSWRVLNVQSAYKRGSTGMGKSHFFA